MLAPARSPNSQPATTMSTPSAGPRRRRDPFRVQSRTERRPVLQLRPLCASSLRQNPSAASPPPRTSSTGRLVARWQDHRVPRLQARADGLGNHDGRHARLDHRRRRNRAQRVCGYRQQAGPSRLVHGRWLPLLHRPGARQRAFVPSTLAGGKPELVVDGPGTVQSFSVGNRGMVTYAIATPQDTAQLFLKTGNGPAQKAHEPECGPAA